MPNYSVAEYPDESGYYTYDILSHKGEVVVRGKRLGAREEVVSHVKACAKRMLDVNDAYVWGDARLDFDTRGLL